ncbi:hypothetical protein MRX96_026622 [Rhipicephalus microplus]
MKTSAVTPVVAGTRRQLFDVDSEAPGHARVRGRDTSYMSTGTRGEASRRSDPGATIMRRNMKPPRRRATCQMECEE